MNLGGKKMICPICCGSGEIKDKKLNDSELKKRACHILKFNGYGTREIQRILGYKSPQSVNSHLKDNKIGYLKKIS